MKLLTLTAALWISAVAASAQTTSVYLLWDQASLTRYADLESLRAEVVDRGAEGQLCALSAFRLHIAVVDGLPVATATPLAIRSTGAEVFEPLENAANCNEICDFVRWGVRGPAGAPADVGDACDCFEILRSPPIRSLRVGGLPL